MFIFEYHSLNLMITQSDLYHQCLTNTTRDLLLVAFEHEVSIIQNVYILIHTLKFYILLALENVINIHIIETKMLDMSNLCQFSLTFRMHFLWWVLYVCFINLLSKLDRGQLDRTLFEKMCLVECRLQLWI